MPPVGCGGPGGQQEIGGGGGAGDGGAAEEMDQEGSDVGGSTQGTHGGTTTPNGWDQMTVAQRQNWHKHRRKKEIKAWAASRDLSRFAR